MCPHTSEELVIQEERVIDGDGEIIDGTLSNTSRTHYYAIRDGIPRFFCDEKYNSCWDYKWRVLDGGKGLNYFVADKNDIAYKIHDLFDSNSYAGKAHLGAKDGICLDVGCGVGQNTYRILREFCPKLCIAMDLTNSGVEIFRKIMLERFPEFKKNLLIIQGSAHNIPVKSESIDYAFSLGVLHHTGNTEKGINELLRTLKQKGTFNIWIYASDVVPYEVKEKERQNKINSPLHYVPTLLRYTIIMFWIHLFRKISVKSKMCFLRVFSSDFYYKAATTRIIRFFANIFFPVVAHPNKDYRLINMWDGYSNDFQDTFSEQELFNMVKKYDGVVLAFSDWRLGVWGTKDSGFYKK